MYNEIIKDKDACNLLCPSEYMIQKLMDEDLIKPFDIPENYRQNVSPHIDKVFTDLGFYTEDGKTYACGYMWGTMGFVYNMDEITAEELNSWSCINSSALRKKVTIKDSVRDTYIMAVGAIYEQELEALDKTDPDYNAKLTEIFNRRDESTLQKVELFLQEARQNIYGFEVDSGKSDIITGKIIANFAWSGDAVYAIDEAESAGVKLGYAVPDEGSNVWFDGFVMTKNTTGQQEKDCVEFLNFISSSESAAANNEYIGYTSVIAGDAVFEYALDSYTAESLVISKEEYLELDEEEKKYYGLYNGEYYSEIDEGVYGILRYDDGVYLETFGLDDGTMVDVGREEVYAVDLKYFFDPDDTEGNYIIYSSEMGRMLYAQYADSETILRCAMMDNFNQSDLERINVMWNKVKLITLSNTTILFIVLASMLIIAVGVIIKFRNKIFRLDERAVSAKNKKTKNKYKVIKKERIY
jgi:spermidine/putrescine transport system substrate-binding protein